MQLKHPLRNEVIVRIVKQECDRVVGGIVLSDKTKEDDSVGVVVSLGPLCTTDLKRGDTVLLPEGRKFKVRIDNIEYRIFEEDAILGIIEEEMI